MPEATMDEERGVMFRKNKIRASGQLPIVQPKAETAGVEPAADHHFRLGVSAPDRHHLQHLRPEADRFLQCTAPGLPEPHNQDTGFLMN